jgi:hypothetical protein
MRRAKLGSLVLVLAPLALSTNACARGPRLEPGHVAPELALAGSDGAVHRLSDHRGRVVVLAWFPKAFTSG